MECARDFTTLMDLGKIPKETVKVVHGSIIPKVGPCAGKRINHAWVEIGDSVIEASNHNQLRVSREGYYKVLSAEYRKKYTIDEASALLDETQFLGPWDLHK